MHTKDFVAAVRAMSGLSEKEREEFVALVDKLSPKDRENVLAHLASLNADITKADRKYASSVKRARLAVREVEENDLPKLDALTRDA